MASTANALKEQFDRKTLSLCRLLELRARHRRFETILVVGCGDGREAATLAGHFGARVTGIDIEGAFDAKAGRVVDLRVMDATNLALADAAFDLVYSFHALEHIPDDRAALREMNRVLRPGGLACIGTPNRRRLVGYIGSATDAWTKIRWNLADWRARALGRFRNEYGAHAGYTRDELLARCREAFGGATDITEDYYKDIYQSKGKLIEGIIKANLQNLLFPCAYVIAAKPGTGPSPS
jgi:SAM-dependent methyltransferase